MPFTPCFECGLAAATKGHQCAACYAATMEEAHRAFYGEEVNSNG